VNAVITFVNQGVDRSIRGSASRKRIRSGTIKDELVVDFRAEILYFVT
jgi:hypothetical protein